MFAVTHHPQRIASNPKDKFLTWKKLFLKSRSTSKSDLANQRFCISGCDVSPFGVCYQLVTSSESSGFEGKKVVESMFSEIASNFSRTKLLPFL